MKPLIAAITEAINQPSFVEGLIIVQEALLGEGEDGIASIYFSGEEVYENDEVWQEMESVDKIVVFNGYVVNELAAFAMFFDIEE